MSSTWAVVTGASSGLGVAFAHRLAAEGADVVLAARSGDRLEEVAADIRARHGVRTRVVPVDLSAPDGRASFVDDVSRIGVSHLINNAGFGSIGEMAELDAVRLTAEVELNVVALTQLTRAVLPGMVTRQRGAIVNVASTAAFQPIPTMAVYAASKAYVLRMSIALWEEVRATGVRVLAICPGPTDTAFFTNAGDGAVMQKRRTPAQVVDATWHGLRRHQPFVVDGLSNKAMAFATRLAPVPLQAALARQVATH